MYYSDCHGDGGGKYWIKTRVFGLTAMGIVG